MYSWIHELRMINPEEIKNRLPMFIIDFIEQVPNFENMECIMFYIII